MVLFFPRRVESSGNSMHNNMSVQYTYRAATSSYDNADAFVMIPAIDFLEKRALVVQGNESRVHFISINKNAGSSFKGETQIIARKL